MIAVFLADGFEEIEALATVDILRRCGLFVQTVSVTSSLEVMGAHNISVLADCTIQDLEEDEIDAVVLPGGMPGTNHLQANEEVKRWILFAKEHEKLLCAICAAPKILGAMGILEGKKAICFPGFEQDLKGAVITGQRVVEDGQIITSKGAGTAHDFAFRIAEKCGKIQEAKEVRKAMQYDFF